MDDTLYKAAAEGHANEDKHFSSLRRAGETYLIVAALIATVTFAASFTLPGGYRDQESIFQSICCVRYHSDDPLSRCCMVLFSYGNGLSFGWESAGGSIHDWVVCCTTTFLWTPNSRFLLCHLLLQLFPCWLCCNLKEGD